MPNKYLREFLPLVTPHAPGVPNMVATFNIRLAAIEFCERTNCWRHVTTQALDLNNPAISVPGYATIHRIEYADFGGKPLTPVAYTDVAYGDLASQGTPRYVTQSAPNLITVLPYADGDLHLSLFLKPSLGFAYGANGADGQDDYYDQVPDFMYLQHGEAIAEGALARILLSDKTAYQNLEQSKFYRDRFDARAAPVILASMQGQQRATIRSKTIWF